MISFSNAGGAGGNGGDGSIVFTYTVATPVPTLSEWAMITFALLIVGFGIYQQRRRQS